ncbi:MAG: MFS transporter [Euryarchaeota archaeon]|nr:MFS transporter [Euryarchaeota archaeon]
MSRRGRINENKSKYSTTVFFIILLGLIGFMADLATDGSKSVTSTYLGLLGASAVTVGFIAGLGELLAHSLRAIFGKLTDLIGNYWIPLLIGYTINLIAVPALALAGNWMEAIWLIILERLGRAVRSPARDAMISHAGAITGRGWAYGVQEALSSIGSMLGPIVIVIVLLLGGNYQLGFEIMILPALVAILLLAYTRRVIPDPKKIEDISDTNQNTILDRTFWFYVLAATLIAAGYADFPVIALHVENFSNVFSEWIPIMFAIVMASNGLAALILGRLYDRVGLLPLIFTSAIIPVFVPMTFFGEANIVMIGMIIYGIGLGAQESIMRAIVADITPASKRGTAFGIYNAAFGISWFLGSMAMGILYGHSIMIMIILSMSLQLMAIPLMLYVMRNHIFTTHRYRVKAPFDGERDI